ncbi:outer membrane beta-barrel family protein [Chitinophaga arvensicola]|uniref:Outer membrane receptor for ferrienterochelin and colicins n=1 Tax=Chitinophaga arvensicola TaxID=29529 RepID=A0A1I0RR67_9BACT|nr:outer membrane beta-barrel family protein [Chitinophaga arvensicola]SEW43260.1 Outer membrane receptor for ferrienterochelin and colicins [Chitinophaga arvensicola]
MNKYYTVRNFLSGKAILLCLFLWGVQLRVSAQSLRVAGRLTDSQEQGVPFAGILLVQLPDSLGVGTAISDTAGRFQLTVPAKGNYLLRVSNMGYRPFTSAVFNVSGTSTLQELGTFALVEDQRMLGTVQIKGSKPRVEHQMDKTVLRIENSVLAEGSTALALLAKMPGVTVDDNGNVSLKGRPGTLVMINGKPTYLSGNQLANLLRGTASGNIANIELMSNPSSRYDAAGKGGIINIVMKKNTKKDLNGNVSLNGGAGRAGRWGAGSSLNYRTGKVNLFGAYSFIYEDLKNEDESERRFGGDTGGTPTLRTLQTSAETARLRGHDFRAGIDVTADEKNTIGFLVSGNIGKYPVTQQTGNVMTGFSGHPVLRDARTLTTGKEHWRDLLYNVNYLHTFNDKGHQLTIDADYVSHFSRMDQQLDTRYFEQDAALPGNSFRKGDIPSYNSIYVLKTDYTLPWKKNGKLEAGWKGSYVRTENNLKYDTLKSGAFVPDLSASNHFIYKEQIQAGYLNLQQDYGKFSIQLGLRGEYTYTEGHQLTTDSLVTRSYFNLFPSIFVSHTFSEEHKLQLSYSRRIERPGYWDLNPFRLYTDPFNYEEGNPYLRPAIANAVELGYSFFSDYYAAATYSRSKDVISPVVGQPADAAVLYSRPENLASFTNYGFSLTATNDITRWWQGTQFANFYYNGFTVQGAEKEVRQGGSFTFDSQNTFSIASGWKAELNALFRSAEVSGVFTTKAYYMISAGAQRDVLKGKGNIKLLVNDIFRSRQIKEWSDYNGIYTFNHRRYDTRSFMLTFTYRFGGAGAQQERRSTGSEELKGRLK